MLPTDAISIIIQGGAVGVLLAFGYGGYQLARRLIDTGSALASNHLSHLTATLEEVNSTLVRLDSTILGCPVREGRTVKVTVSDSPVAK